MPFCDFTLAAPKKSFFFLIHSLNLRKKENRCFDNILFVNDSSVITKYPFLTLSCVLKVGRARWECLFEHSLYKEKPDFKKMILR